MRSGLAIFLLLLTAAPGPLAAQGDCFPSPHSREAQTFAILSVPLAFSAGGAPAELPRWAIEAGLEASYLPNVDDATATPTICRPGKGPENVNILPGFLRPRVRVGLPAGFALEAAWTPPVRVKGVRANLAGIALSRLLTGGPLRLALRGHATFGVIEAPVTCDAAALRDPGSECFQGTLSNDSYHPNILGLDLLAGWSPGTPGLAFYASAGYVHLAPRFRVNFTNQFGETDRRRVEVDLDRLSIGLGATLEVTTRWTVSGEISSTPVDAVTGRVIGRVKIR